jgi:Tol biopolymer transport system component
MNLSKNLIYLLSKFLVLSLCFILVEFARAQPEAYNHPELYWQSIETDHFIVHYHQGTERTANLVAKIVEEMYPHITNLYQYWPKEKTQFVIRDTDDYSNGGAYFYDNKVEIWAENMDYVLRGTHNWLRDVVSHEYTHIISMRKALKFGPHVPAGWFQLFGYETERRPDVVRGFPDVLVSYPISGITIPVWFAEGTAQFQSPSRRYDYRDSHREMILRDRVVTGKLLDLQQMGVFGKNSIGNESSYNQGYAFVSFLAKTFGDSIVKKMAHQAAAPLTLTFDGVMKETTGIAADSIFRMWDNYLEDTYSHRLETINKNLVTGEAIQDEGIGNIHPVFSPDGEEVAYVKSISDYLSINALAIKNLKTEKEKLVDGPITSSVSWSPSGRYLAYSKQTHIQPNGSSFNDIYVYDTKRHKTYQITNGLRASNPDWSHDGEKLAFVVSSDGLTNLFVLTLDEFVWIKDKKLWYRYYYDLDGHFLTNDVPDNRKDDWQRYYRRVAVWGRDINQITHFTDGRQIFHPRWSPDDSYLVFDTSIDFCRDIARIPSTGGEMEFILNAPYDERYPTFDPTSGELFYASDQTGIFDIYSYDLETKEIKPHTNVIGGAFMPTVNKRGDLIYSLYKDQGYKIYLIRKVNALPAETLVYDQNYQAKIPQIKADDRTYQPLPSREYNRSFGAVGVMPRLFMDYGTLKPGLYVYSNEILDKMMFFGGFDFNLRKDYDIFALFGLQVWKFPIQFELYNQATNIDDKLEDPFYREVGDHSINFNLLEADLGTWLKLYWKGNPLFNLHLTYILSLYRARISTFGYRELATNQLWISPEFRYTYLRGHALELQLKQDRIIPDIDRAINPRRGYYFSLKYTRQWNRFLDDFATDRVIDLEIYKKYYYNQYELDYEKYFTVPFTKRHSLSFRMQGGYIDKKVDDYFNFFAGGLVGLKGYSYFSIDGPEMAIGTVTYRFPLVRNLNFRIVNWYLDKIYLGAFYQYGNAWEKNAATLKDFKSDVGVQLRIETFSWYMFPTRIFFEAAYPLKENIYQDIRYEKDWKFYFGVLFDFDLRFDKKLRRLL